MARAAHCGHPQGSGSWHDTHSPRLTCRWSSWPDVVERRLEVGGQALLAQFLLPEIAGEEHGMEGLDDVGQGVPGRQHLGGHRRPSRHPVGCTAQLLRDLAQAAARAGTRRPVRLRRWVLIHGVCSLHFGPAWGPPSAVRPDTAARQKYIRFLAARMPPAAGKPRQNPGRSPGRTPTPSMMKSPRTRTSVAPVPLSGFRCGWRRRDGVGICGTNSRWRLTCQSPAPYTPIGTSSDGCGRGSHTGERRSWRPHL